MTTTTERRMPAWLLPVGIGFVVVALVTIALTRGPVELDPDTPEGTVQEYLLAISEERWDDALAVIHDDWRGTCEGFDLQAFAPGDFSAELGSNGFEDIELRDRSVAPGGEGEPGPTIPNSATLVDVTINRHDGGGLGNTWQEFVTFEVTFDGDFWWIVGDPWPYFIFSCLGQ
jgi:hypothetical protein